MTTPEVGGNRPFFQKSKNFPEVIAHRGGGGEWPEETLYAFEQAIKIGVDVLEMDVHLTIDGELVLMHNATVDATTDGTGRIGDLTLAEIKKLNAAAKWPPDEKYKDIKVPTLPEVFEAFPDMRMNIEIKQKEPSLVTPLCKLLREKKMTDKVLIASGWNSVLHEFRRECPEVATSASVLEVEEFNALDVILNWNYRPDTDAIQWHSEFIVHIITQKFMDKARSLNLKVHAWTVNELEEMRRMISLGVDGIITDYPSRLLKLLGRLS
jgi:glycerophosphoryl diester phosphodiesterase